MTNESIELIKQLIMNEYNGAQYKKCLMNNISHDCAAWEENESKIKAAKVALDEFIELVR